MAQRFTADLAVAIWQRAKEAEIGIALALAEEDQVQVKHQLNDIRKKLNDPELYDLTITHPEGGKEIWLVKKETNLDD